MKMNTTKPKISICIPTFNRSDLLDKTLQSVANQSQKPYEVIVVDNHSTDATPDVVKKYKKHGFKYFRNKKNLGFVGNWNKCLDLSNGNYICILHSDDIISRDWYKDWEKIIGKYPNVDAFFSPWAFINLKNQVTSVYFPFSKSQLFKRNKVIKEFYSKNVLSPQVSGGLILHKDLFKNDQIGRFQPKLETEADIAMFFPLMTHYSLYYYNKLLLGYRIHPYQTVDKKVENSNKEKFVMRAERYVNYLHKFYYNDLVPTIGDYDLFYKKLLIYYQIRSIFRSFTFKRNVLSDVNNIIYKYFPSMKNGYNTYLYVIMGVEVLRREIMGRLIASKYKDIFTND